MPTALFESYDAARGWALCLDRPQSVIVARRLEDVRSLLAQVDAAAHSGKFVALMLSYEAAAAFDPAFKTHSPDRFPLAWAAIFETAAPVTTTEMPRDYKVSAWQPAISKPDYEHAIQSIRKLIAAGETYQVNYTFRMSASFEGDARRWYRDLCLAQRAGFSAFLDLGSHKIISLSPELFFERRGDLIITRPMKGTIRRGRWLEEDEKLGDALRLSEKDRAENIMIVDLLRNDLGRIAIPGTVNVSKVFETERYETLWQMTSTVTATARPGTSLLDLFGALFPCGSITGAPKVRTMEIIRTLEPSPRHLFTGAIGFVKPGGDCVFNVAIRTVILDAENDGASFSVGGGVTFDSTALGEYEECLIKSNFLHHRPEPFQLLETILLEEGNYFLLDDHLSRLDSSARYFGFALDESAVRTALLQTANSYPTDRLKIRLLLNRRGEIEVQATTIESDECVPIRIALAATPIDSHDRFQFHKTTNRSRYELALRERPDCDDVILWNERDEITESTIANLVVTIEGTNWTPARSSGLLAGTFRNKLLVEGAIKERVIHKHELTQADAIYLINSVRKWVPALPVTTFC